ncbi:hypothetical protein D3C81_1592870 [compost metagenome]
MIITPAEVRSYTAFDSVKARTDEQLEWDIVQASQDIYVFAGHDFTDPEKYPVDNFPKIVKLAFLKLTEYYALVNSSEAGTRGIVSEKIGDYSYQLGENSQVMQSFSLENLLAGHIQGGKSGMTVKLRVV